MDLALVALAEGVSWQLTRYDRGLRHYVVEIVRPGPGYTAILRSLGEVLPGGLSSSPTDSRAASTPTLWIAEGSLLAPQPGRASFWRPAGMWAGAAMAVGRRAWRLKPFALMNVKMCVRQVRQLRPVVRPCVPRSTLQHLLGLSGKRILEVQARSLSLVEQRSREVERRQQRQGDGSGRTAVGEDSGEDSTRDHPSMIDFPLALFCRRTSFASSRTEGTSAWEPPGARRPRGSWRATLSPTALAVNVV